MFLKRFHIVLVLLATVVSCSKEATLPPIDETKDLDGKLINDSSLQFPEAYLLSAANPNPSGADLLKPVLILVHGFSASTFEWAEFKEWLKPRTDVLSSVVLLGGHGRDYEDFRKATWSDWQAPIVEEYNKLLVLGYRHIAIVASSTGGPLVLNMIRRQLVQASAIKQVLLIDPMLIPGNKQLALIPGLKGFLPYAETTIEKGEGGYWYKYRPAEALQQLEKLSRQERNALEKGYSLPTGVRLKVYKSIHDNAVDPVSAVQLFKGLKHSDGSAIEVSMEASNLHVFTRLRGRNTYSEADRVLQQLTFQNLYERAK